MLFKGSFYKKFNLCIESGEPPFCERLNHPRAYFGHVEQSEKPHTCIYLFLVEKSAQRVLRSMTRCKFWLPSCLVWVVGSKCLSMCLLLGKTQRDLRDCEHSTLCLKGSQWSWWLEKEKLMATGSFFGICLQWEQWSFWGLSSLLIPNCRST